MSCSFTRSLPESSAVSKTVKSSKSPPEIWSGCRSRSCRVYRPSALAHEAAGHWPRPSLGCQANIRDMFYDRPGPAGFDGSAGAVFGSALGHAYIRRNKRTQTRTLQALTGPRCSHPFAPARLWRGAELCFEILPDRAAGRDSVGHGREQQRVCEGQHRRQVWMMIWSYSARQISMSSCMWGDARISVEPGGRQPGGTTFRFGRSASG